MKPAEETQESKEERIARKGKYALAVLNSPTGSSNHTREKEYQHSSKEHDSSQITETLWNRKPASTHHQKS